MTEPLFLELADSRAQDSSRVGGKAAGLARICTIPGIPVPPAVLITTAAYSAFFDAHPELRELVVRLDKLTDPQLISHQALAVEQAVRTAPLPDKLLDMVAAAYGMLSRSLGTQEPSVSVRSSATAEDMQTASFAGQYATCLSQRGFQAVLDSVRKVWASSFVPNAVNYRNRLGLPHSAVRMAVILQQMIDARAAGTAYTVDLETGAPLIRIHANHGLGEAEVRGTVTPDVWLVDPINLTVIMRCLGGKTEKIGADGYAGQLLVHATTSTERSQYALDLPTVRNVARGVKRIGETYLADGASGYIDAEFAVDRDGHVSFLQARPETVWSRQTARPNAVNLEKAAALKQVLTGGITGSPGVATGVLRVVASLEEAEQRVQPGDVLVVANTTNLWERVLGLAAAAITDIGGAGSHTATVLREQGKPALVGVQVATDVLKAFDNHEVTLDATQRIVFLSRVHPHWLYTPELGSPCFGTLDQETEEESWAEATQTGQTHLDSGNRRWIGKPRHPVSHFMQEVYLECHQRIAERLSTPVTAKMEDEIHWIDFHELFQWRLKLRAMTLEQLEELHTERMETTRAYLEACERFELTPDALVKWLDLLVRMNAFMGLSYQIFKVTEGLLDHELASRRLSEPYYSQVRLAMGALAGETEATRELREYGALLHRARQDRAFRQELHTVKTLENLGRLARFHPESYAALRQHARTFKVAKSTDLALTLEDSILEIVLRMDTDLSRDRHVQVNHVRAAEFYPEDERFVRIARLTVESEKARQDAHHLNHRGHWPVRERLEPLAQWLTQRGEASSVADLFNHPPAWLLRQVVRYGMASTRQMERLTEVPAPPPE